MTALTSGNTGTETSLTSHQMPETGEIPLLIQAVPRPEGGGGALTTLTHRLNNRSFIHRFIQPSLLQMSHSKDILQPHSLPTVCTVCNQQQQNLCELIANDCLSQSLTPAVTKGGNLPLRRGKGGRIFVSLCFRSRDSLVRIATSYRLGGPGLESQHK
jgi:hypothetical protein